MKTVLFAGGKLNENTLEEAVAKILKIVFEKQYKKNLKLLKWTD